MRVSQEIPLQGVTPVDGWALTSFMLYLLIVVGIGVYAARFSSRGLSEFFIAGRRMNRFVVALSAVASGRSAWLMLGMTGMAFTMGVAAIWAAIGYTTAECLLFLFYAPRIRRFAGAHDCITFPDVLARRFQDDDGRLRLALAAVFSFFLVAYIAAQFVGGGKALATSFNVAPTTGILLTAGIVLAYTVLGGFLAVSLTDAFQGTLMLIALVGLPLIVASDLGGVGAVLTELRSFSPSMLDPLALTAGAAIGFVGIGLGAPGNPHIVIRYISIRDPREFVQAAIVGTTWNVLLAAGAIMIGLVGRAYVPDVSGLPLGDAENLLPFLAQRFLPSVLFGVVVAAIFAAIMSTADSQLLVMASTIVRDVYQQIWRKGEALEEDRLVLLSRLVIAGLVVVAVALGLLADQLIFWLVLFAVAGLGGAIGPASVLAIFWRGATRAGVLAGMAVGTATTIVWFLTPALKAIVYELVPAFILGMAVTIIVSRVTRPPDGVDEMFAVMRGDDQPAAEPAIEYAPPALP